MTEYPFYDCTKCNLPKHEDRFRIKSKVKNGKEYFYRQHKCLDCEAAEQRSRSVKHRNDPAWMENNRVKANQYYWKNREKVKLKAKEYRGRPASKERKKEYIKKNFEKISADHKKIVTAWTNFHKENMTDTYIKNKLKWSRVNGANTGLGELDPTPDMIELKRLQITLMRELKNKGHKVSIKYQGGKRQNDKAR